MENRVNENGLNLLKSFEKLRLRAYDDFQPNRELTALTKIVGTLTIGWGHTGRDVKFNSVWTKEKSDIELLNDIKNAETIVQNLLKRKVNDNEYSALVSFAYNSGGGYVSRKTGKWTPYELWRFVNENNIMIKEKWISTAITSKGVKMKGLINRRNAEVKLFFKKI